MSAVISYRDFPQWIIPLNTWWIERPAGLVSSAAAVPETESKCKILKICQKFQKENFENLFQTFLCIGTDIMCAKFHEN